MAERQVGCTRVSGVVGVHVHATCCPRGLTPHPLGRHCAPLASLCVLGRRLDVLYAMPQWAPQQGRAQTSPCEGSHVGAVRGGAPEEPHLRELPRMPAHQCMQQLHLHVVYGLYLYLASI